MEWGDVVAVMGLVLAGIGLVLHVLRYFRDRGREDRQHLSDLALSLFQLKDAAMAHFRSAPDPDTEGALTSRLDAATYLAERSEWEDVREAARRALVIAGRFRERAERVKADADVELPHSLEAAVKEATATIGARSDGLRGARNPKRS